MMYDADKPMLIGLVMLISVILGLLATGILGGSLFPYNTDEFHLKKLTINGAIVYAEIADTPEKRVQGLSDRDRMAENRAMLFVFEESGKYPIWMRNMRFPLDIYWLDGKGVIVDMWQNAHPDSYPQIYEPQDEAYYIIELVAGFSEVYNVRIGDRVQGI